MNLYHYYKALHTQALQETERLLEYGLKLEAQREYKKAQRYLKRANEYNKYSKKED